MLLAETSDVSLTMYVLAGVGAGIVAMATAVWKMATYAVHRVFDEDGELAKNRKQNGEFYKGLLDGFAEQRRLCDMHGKAVSSLAERFQCGARFETVETNKGIIGLLEHQVTLLDSHEMDEDKRKQALRDLSSAIEMLKAHNQICEVCDGTGRIQGQSGTVAVASESK